MNFRNFAQKGVFALHKVCLGFLDAYRPLRELCIYTTVLNEFAQVYAQMTPKTILQTLMNDIK